MKKKLTYGLSLILGLGLAGCGGEGGDLDAGPIYTYDAAPPPIDTAPPAEPLVWLSIQDTEQEACTTNGPGSDIDAVALFDATGVLGVGLLNSANFRPNPLGNACDNVDCSGSNCKYAAISGTFTEADLVARTEGPADATVNETTSDTGYFSLNAGTLLMQIGGPTGLPPAQALKSGDYIKVFEVDQSYIASGAAFPGCICAPEHYTVTLLSATGNTQVKLQPVELDVNNTVCAAPVTGVFDGCGSTVFVVP